MRIAVAGKGGSGKTTITGILARTFARDGYKVLAIDADPNPNMALAMGVSQERAAELPVIPRDMAHWEEDDNGQPFVKLQQPLAQIAADYGVAAPDGIRLLVTGQITAAGVGCMCQPHTIARGLMANVGDWADFILTDMEAGLEHLSRGTTEHADVMLVVVEPYFRSLDTGARAATLAQELGIPEIFFLANKLRTENERHAVRELAQKKGFELIAEIPLDEQLPEADRLGLSPLDFAPNSPGVQAIERLAHRLQGQRRETKME
ncbi:MAG: AAA family ATPase [Chloroflexi bacterium]|nr:AAA family ATPase [Chloroflexota bacterium]